MEIRRVLGDSSLYAIGNISRQIVGFIMLPIYTRYLSPEDYGLVALLVFLISVIDVTFGARLSQAVMKFYFQYKEQSDRNAVFSSALIQTGAISLIVVIAVVLGRGQLSEVLFDSNSYSLIIALFGVTILTSAIENYGLIFLRLNNRAKDFFFLNVSKLIMQVFLNVYLIIFLELGVMGVVLSNVCSSIVFSIIISVITISKTGLHYNKAIGIMLVKFNWPLWLAGFANLYIGSSNRYILKEFASLTDIGLLELATRFSGILLLVIWEPFFLYWGPERFNIYNSDARHSTVYQSVFMIVSAVLFSAGLGISVLSWDIINIMSPESYIGAATAVPVLVLCGIFQCLKTFFNFSLLATDNTKKISFVGYFTAAICTIYMLFLIPKYGFIGASVALCLTFSTQFLILRLVAVRYFDSKIIIWPLAFMVPAFLMLVYVMQYFQPSENVMLNLFYRFLLTLVLTIPFLATPFILKRNRNELLGLMRKYNIIRDRQADRRD